MAQNNTTKDQERAAQQEKYNAACSERDMYKKHYHDSLQAILHLETAVAGLIFMDGEQRDFVSDELSNGVYPNNEKLYNALSLGVSPSGGTYVSKVESGLNILYADSPAYKNKMEECADLANRLYWEMR